MGEDKNNQLYREKSLNRLNSPESLNETIKAVTPSVWLIMSVVIVFLLTLLLWAIFGTINTTVNFPVVSSGGSAYCYIEENEYSSLKGNNTVDINQTLYTLGKPEGLPVRLSEDNQTDAYILHHMTNITGEWFYKVPVEGSLEDGIYNGTIILDSVKPISFVID